MGPRQVLAAILVALLWALCYPLITTGLGAAPPLWFGAVRALAAGGVLLGAALLLRHPWPRGVRLWAALAAAGLCLTGLGFAGMFLAGGRISPGVATVLANLQPLLATGLAYPLLGERPGAWAVAGLVAGFAGIVVVAVPGLQHAGAATTPAGVACVLLGVVGVAVGNVLLKRIATDVDILVGMGLQLVFGAALLGTAALLLEDATRIHWGPRFVVVTAVLAWPGTALAFTLWQWLLRTTALGRANAFTFLTPVFGLALAAGLYGERLDATESFGVVLVALGLAGVVWQRSSPRGCHRGVMDRRGTQCLGRRARAIRRAFGKPSP